MTYKGSGHGNVATMDAEQTSLVCGVPAALSVQTEKSNTPKGLPSGTEVMTAKGTVLVDELCAGDRIITRGGMRTLRGIDSPAPGLFQLIFEKVEVVYADGQMVMGHTGQRLDA